MRISWATRVLIVVTAIWIITCFAGATGGRRGFDFEQFAGYGLIPPLLIWGTLWVISGFKKERQETKKKE